MKKKALYLFYIPLLVIEWLFDLIGKIWNQIHDSVKTLTLVIESYINEPTGTPIKNDKPTPGS